MARFWLCRNCGAEHIPDDCYTDFWCYCGPMDGVENKCVFVDEEEESEVDDDGEI